MFSEALAIADRNAELLWIDEMQAYTKKLEDEVDELKKETNELKKESATKDQALADRLKEIEELKSQLAKKQ